MPWTQIDGRSMSIPEFEAHLHSMLWNSWRPIGIVWHNTASPTLAQWKRYTPQHWLESLSSYYQSLGWNAGPHLFIDHKQIHLFTPLNMRGTHSPSFNAQYIGIEHVGDYSTEDDDAGDGLLVKQNGIAATALLCARLGIKADRSHIKLHKEDPRTTHDCPGKDMAQDVTKSVAAVSEYMATGGDHAPDWGNKLEPTAPTRRIGRTTVPNVNLRDASSMSGNVLAELSMDRPVDVYNEVQNGGTLWYHVRLPDKPLEGWVAARYIKIIP